MSSRLRTSKPSVELSLIKELCDRTIRHKRWLKTQIAIYEPKEELTIFRLNTKAIVPNRVEKLIEHTTLNAICLNEAIHQEGIICRITDCILPPTIWIRGSIDFRQPQGLFAILGNELHTTAHAPQEVPIIRMGEATLIRRILNFFCRALPILRFEEGIFHNEIAASWMEAKAVQKFPKPEFLHFIKERLVKPSDT